MPLPELGFQGPKQNNVQEYIDTFTSVGGKAVTDLYTYTDALYANQPGDRVTIVFLRGARRDSVRVTLGRRGG